MKNIQRVKTISEYHRTRRLQPPEHPLISIIDYAEVNILPEYDDNSWVLDFYFIALKRNLNCNIRYGQEEYDFDEGVMFFIAPGQVFSLERNGLPSPDKSGWMLLIHPDFFWNTALAKAIKNYDYFGYSLSEALFVSKKEETTMMGIVRNIQQEYNANMDKFSQNIIISQIETMLNYSERFYNRQFLTRKKANHQVLDRMEHLLNAYFDSEDMVASGLPTVQLVADQLNVSTKYLSSLLKGLTGQTAQQHIHEKLIQRAKEKLSTTALTIGEVAYDLGFEYPQSFSKLFKSKTGVSPLEFRQSFMSN